LELESRTTSGVDFSSGDITPTAYSINTTSGIGIYHYTCTGANATMVHGLSSAPKMLITKSLGDTAPWAVWHTGMNPTNYLVLDTTAAEVTGTAMWNSTAPSSSVISLGSDGQSNGSGKNNIMYAFSDVKGYSAFGAYEGNSNVDGPFIYTGFRPAMVIIKNIDRSEPWKIWDTKRSPYNTTENTLNVNDDTAQNSSAVQKLGLYANGFKVRTTSTEINTSTCVYAAFAEFPLVSSNSKAGVAR